MSNEAVVVTAYFFPAEGRRDDVLAALRAAIPRVHDEPGCNLYCIQEAPDGTIVMLEHWDNAELLDAHGAGAPVAALNRALEGALAKPVQVTRLVALPIGDPRKGQLIS